MYHEVMYGSEIEAIKELASPRVRRNGDGEGGRGRELGATPVRGGMAYPHRWLWMKCDRELQKTDKPDWS